MELLDKEFYLKKEILKKNKYNLSEITDELSDFEKSSKVNDLFLIYLSDSLNLSFEFDYNLELSFFDEDLGVIIITYQEDEYNEYNGHGDYDHYIYKYLIDFEKNQILKIIKN